MFPASILFSTLSWEFTFYSFDISLEVKKVKSNLGQLGALWRANKEGHISNIHVGISVNTFETWIVPFSGFILTSSR